MLDMAQSVQHVPWIIGFQDIKFHANDELPTLIEMSFNGAV